MREPNYTSGVNEENWLTKSEAWCCLGEEEFVNDLQRIRQRRQAGEERKPAQESKDSKTVAVRASRAQALSRPAPYPRARAPSLNEPGRWPGEALKGQSYINRLQARKRFISPVSLYG